MSTNQINSDFKHINDELAQSHPEYMSTISIQKNDSSWHNRQRHPTSTYINVNSVGRSQQTNIMKYSQLEEQQHQQQLDLGGSYPRLDAVIIRELEFG